MTMVASQKKCDLRQKLLEKLLSLTKEELKRRSKNVAERISSLPIYKQAKVIMVYYPLRGEVDILAMIRKDLRKKRFCFPVMDLETNQLRAFEVKDLDRDFVKGPYGVMQPDLAKTNEIAISEIDMVIVPGLAFDRCNNRLGRGAGFYDRFLSRIKPTAKKVGICFEFQILDNLPIHPQLDQKVDIVVSEN